jgi:cytochrome c biogenesis protein CcmG/thiol:disulfide interchange protein DsbE
MGNPFKFFGAFALALIVVAGIFGWFVTATPARDELGTIPVPPASAPPPDATPPAAQEAARPPDLLHKPAPALELPGLESGRFSLASYRGKSPVILFFFATWWPHCREEVPHLIRLYNQHRERGLAAVAITQEKPEEAGPFLKQNPLPFPVVYDDEGKTATLFGVDGIPVTYAVDREGKLVASHHGFMEEAFQQEFAAQVARLVAQ